MLRAARSAAIARAMTSLVTGSTEAIVAGAAAAALAATHKELELEEPVGMVAVRGVEELVGAAVAGRPRAAPVVA